MIVFIVLGVFFLIIALGYFSSRNGQNVLGKVVLGPQEKILFTDMPSDIWVTGKGPRIIMYRWLKVLVTNERVIVGQRPPWANKDNDNKYVIRHVVRYAGTRVSEDGSLSWWQRFIAGKLNMYLEDRFKGLDVEKKKDQAWLVVRAEYGGQLSSMFGEYTLSIATDQIAKYQETLQK